MSEMQQRILLVARPKGEVGDECLKLVSEPIPEPGQGEALIRTLYVSLDPTIRGWMNDEAGYMPPIGIGEVVRAGAVGEVVASNSQRYAVGDRVFGMLGWQEYTLADEAGRAVQVLPPGVSPTDAIGVFGITGMTAYFGMLEVGQPKQGDTVVVSGAAGATGSVAGQIAKIKGCRVVGIAGTPEKCAWVTDELGYDACINYRAGDIGVALRAACPQGIDVYFDNVGGEILDAVLLQLNQGARIAMCGAISGYNLEGPPPGPRNLMQLILKRARMEGFLVLDYMSRFPEAMQEMGPWVAAGRVNNRVDVVQGLENTPAAFQRLFSGANTGKLLVQVAAAD